MADETDSRKVKISDEQAQFLIDEGLNRLLEEFLKSQERETGNESPRAAAEDNGHNPT